MEVLRQIGFRDLPLEFLAQQTVAGAGRYALISDTPPGTLREQVTSPNGTTAAALAVRAALGRALAEQLGGATVLAAVTVAADEPAGGGEAT